MPKDNEVDENVPVYVATAPERIYLQVADDAYYAEDPFPAEEEVTWCADSVMELEVSYVREDLHAATVAELRAEVEKARIAGIDACDKLTALWQKDIDRADAAERRVGEFEKLMTAARRAIGDHHAPNDCYATGPLTGDAFLDLVQCPACAFLEQHATLTGADPT